VIERLRYSLALSVMSAPGQRGIWERLEGSTPEAVYAMVAREGPVSTQDFISARYSRVPLDAAGEILDACAKKRVEVVDLPHPDYPPLLREIKNPPLVLFRRGPMPRAASISIVGTRAADPHSSRTARRFAAEFAGAGFVVASGMALGIDREAHLGALEAGGGTIGVLANGIDIAYPSRNRDLFSAIAASERSCLLSEYPPGILAGKWTFVRRNRIISGLSRGTLVVKAGDKSGALITASCAAEQGREVFACPGPAFDESYAGCHRLIRSGAALASTPGDVLQELGAAVPSVKNYHAEAPVPEKPPAQPDISAAYAEGSLERKIIEQLASATAIDEVIRALGAPAGEVHQTLNLLEIEGIVTKRGNTVSLSR
jgi:DNA processing protein